MNGRIQMVPSDVSRFEAGIFLLIQSNGARQVGLR
jgi:hypothetical protein